jgi:hypothetical protein
MKVHVPELGMDYDVKFGKEHVKLMRDSQNRCKFKHNANPNLKNSSIRTHCIISRVTNGVGPAKYVQLVHTMVTRDTRDVPNKTRGKREALSKALNKLVTSPLSEAVYKSSLNLKLFKQYFWREFIKEEIKCAW